VSHSEPALSLEDLIRIERIQEPSETNDTREVTMDPAADKRLHEAQLVSTAIRKSGKVVPLASDAAIEVST
jgi:hypothetical protein